MTPFPRKSHQNVQIETDIYERMRAIAERTNESPTRMINQALEEWLRTHERDDSDNDYRARREY